MTRIASFFAGVGGIDLGFRSAGYKTVWANEIDKYAVSTFKTNFDCPCILDDIKNIDPADIPPFDLLVAGFPCQAFSVAGYQKGFEDERGTMFFELVRIIKKCKPKILFLENVRFLLTHDRGRTFEIISQTINNLGYKLHYKILSGHVHANIPQCRERIFLIAFLDDIDFVFPEPITLTRSIKDLVDFDNKVGDRYYYNPNKCKFYQKLVESITEPYTLYQWRRNYIRPNKRGLCPTLTASMGIGGCDVPLILTPFGIRKLTPFECFKLQGFPDNFVFPENLSHAQLYKQAGNSVIVPLITRIAKML